MTLDHKKKECTQIVSSIAVRGEAEQVSSVTQIAPFTGGIL